MIRSKGSRLIPATDLVLKPLTNIMDYGADNTGTKDFTPALIAALAASPSVYLPNGVFLVETPFTHVLTQGQSVSLVGSGIGSTVIRMPAGWTFSNTSGWDETNLTIEGMKFQPIGAGLVKAITLIGTGAVSVLHAITLEKLLFSSRPSDYFDTAALMQGSVGQVTVSNTVVYGQSAGMGFYFWGSSTDDRGGQAQIVNCALYQLNCGIVCHDWMQGIDVANCTLLSNRSAIYAPRGVGNTGRDVLTVSGSSIGVPPNGYGVFAEGDDFSDIIFVGNMVLTDLNSFGLVLNTIPGGHLIGLNKFRKNGGGAGLSTAIKFIGNSAGLNTTAVKDNLFQSDGGPYHALDFNSIPDINVHTADNIVGGGGGTVIPIVSSSGQAPVKVF